MCRELAALNNEVGGAEHAQWILLSSVKASLYATTNTRAILCAASASAILVNLVIFSYNNNNNN